MACGCGNIGLLSPNTEGVRTGYTAAYDGNGMYQLSAAPGCDQPYSGDYRRESVYVVGIGTEGEQIFTRRRSREAIDYSKANGLKLNHLPCNALCDSVMREFFGS